MGIAVKKLAACALLASSAAEAQVLKFDISKRESKTPMFRRRLAKRDDSTVTSDISNDLTLGGYFVTAKIGTPTQTLKLQLDTGSSDIWVPYSGASVCTSDESYDSSGCTLGSFDPDKSSTFTETEDDKDAFDISYVDGSGSKGDYFEDNFQIGGTTVKNMTMGLGIETDIAYGLIGVGYSSNEAIVGQEMSLSAKYDNLPVKLLNEHLVATNAYSLWLNDLGASTGQILFGGIDTKKYEGDLTRIDVQKDKSGIYTSFEVLMTAMTAKSSSGTDSLTSSKFPIPVVLDSGTTLSYLPTDLVNQIWKEVGASYSSSYGVGVIPCSMAGSKGTFEFQLGGPNGPTISVGMDELVLSLSEGTTGYFSGGKDQQQDTCMFGLQNYTSSPYLLGDTFLRSAYVVYDLVNNEVAVAKTDFNSTESNVVAFPSKGATIPRATTASKQPSSAAVTGTLSTPKYEASSGFHDGVSNAAVFTTPAFDLAQVMVIGATVAFTMVGGGFFLL